MKIILITGISGSDVNGFAEAVVQAGNQDGRLQWIHQHFAKLLYEVDTERGKLSYSDWENSILRRNAALPHLRNAAYDRLLEIKDDLADKETPKQETVLLVSTHATFWYRKTLQAGLDLSRVNELAPDIFVTIVDDVLNIWDRLLQTKQPRWQEFSPIDILEWREIEVFLTEQLAQIFSKKNSPKPFFLLPRAQPSNSLVRILAEPGTPRFYRSYPMTFVANRPEVQQTADDIGSRLEEVAVVFDPADLEDWNRKDELQTRYQSWCQKRGYTSSGADWEDIEKHLRHQTVSRDHKLIDQSHGIVVYYPELDYWTKREADFDPTPLVPFSSGVLDEMQYATQYGKDVYLIWTSDRDPGPFLSTIYSEKFRTVDELIDFLKARQEKLSKGSP
jgi:adenylate kinase